MDKDRQFSLAGNTSWDGFSHGLTHNVQQKKFSSPKLSMNFMNSASGPCIGVFGNSWCLYLFECKWFGFLLGGSCLPHTDGSAGATGDNQLWVWTYGTKNLTPFCQTLVHHQRLERDYILSYFHPTTKTTDCLHNLTEMKFVMTT